MIPKLVKYGIVGGVSTSVHVSVAFVTLNSIPSSLLANLLGFLVALGGSYYMNARFVFESRMGKASFRRFALINGSIMVLVAVSSSIFDYYQVSPYLSVLFAVVLIPLLGFFSHLRWTFGSPKE